MSKSIAIWALTPNAVEIAKYLAQQLGSAHLFVAAKLEVDTSGDTTAFDKLKPAVEENFRKFAGHIFIMATGIVVRTLAQLLVHKTKDPAVVVMDEGGKFAISLVSGHLGGANDLARKAANITFGQAVITTATDVNNLPSIDLIAQAKGLKIETPEAIKTANMAILTKKSIAVYDPYHQLKDYSGLFYLQFLDPSLSKEEIVSNLNSSNAGILIDDRNWQGLNRNVLILRPQLLSVGIGCNRGTAVEEMRKLLELVFHQFNLSLQSIATLASVDLKSDEEGLLELARQLNFKLSFFTRPQLAKVEHIPNPSAVVDQHIGVKSVCEAAAILGAQTGRLIVSKQKTPNVTLAIARRDFTS